MIKELSRLKEMAAKQYTTVKDLSMNMKKLKLGDTCTDGGKVFIFDKGYVQVTAEGMLVQKVHEGSGLTNAITLDADLLPHVKKLLG
jgi:hypothetical protein